MKLIRVMLHLLYVFLLLLLSSSVFALNPKIPYSAIKFEESETCITALLKYTGNDHFYVKETSPWARILNFTATFEGDTEFQITITDAEIDRFKLPYHYPFAHTKELPPARSRQYSINITMDPFSFMVIRNGTQEIIFDTRDIEFVYSDLSIHIGTQLPTRFLYGLGERRSSFLLTPGTYTIYARDHRNSTIDDGTPGTQLSGAHPVYLMREKSRLWHTVLFRNINAMDFIYSLDNKLVFKTIGGIIEFKFFLGNQYPDSAISQYHRYTNGIALTPFWAHGWHQSRWGIKNFEMLKAIVDNYTANFLPLDTIWSDVDYRHESKDFTVNDKFKPEALSALLKSTTGLHWVPIIDPSITISADNPAYYEGLTKNVFISSPTTSKPVVSRIWSGDAHPPDFGNQITWDYWADFCGYLHNQVPFSGIWMSRNEFSNLCDGECNILNPKGLTSKDLPYVPNNGSLEEMSLPLGAMHMGGFTEKDVHNANGFLGTYASKYFFKERLGVALPFILSRSTMIGSGSLGQHWTGDNWSSYEYMRLSIPILFSNQIFGNIMSGEDVCGFNGNADELLCSYWMQLGALYPFARNHNSNSSIDQMPFQMNVTLLETSRAALEFRYSIIKWYYSIFIRNAGTGTVFRPMFFEYPSDDSLLALETQFMIGHELLAAPCLENTTNCAVDVYFPAGARFYDFKTGAVIQNYSDPAQNKTVQVRLNDSIPVFISAGSVVYTQNVSGVNNTHFLNNSFELVVAFKQVGPLNYAANGVMLGISNYNNEESVASKCSGEANCLVDIQVTGGFSLLSTGFSVNITFTPRNNKTSPFEENYIFRVKYYGVKTPPCEFGGENCDTEFTAIRKCDFFLVAPNSTILDVLDPYEL